MNTGTDRAEIRTLLSNFVTAWETGAWQSASSLLAENAQVVTSHLSTYENGREFITALQQDRANSEILSLKATNHFIGGGETEATFSCYIYGQIRSEVKRSKLGFGMTMKGALKKNGVKWQLDNLLISLNWVTDDLSLASHWKLPPGDDGWRIGDSVPTIVSELDSPWIRFPRSMPSGAVDEGIADTYARYSWALDQADMQLLSDCFTADAAGDFQPMGVIKGRHAIIGSFKGFRRPWPWMQHFAEVLEIKADEALGVAEMIVGRVIPGNSHAEDGTALYGAYYRMRLRRKFEGFWQLTWSEYRPGWFSAQEAPQL
ncbi:nuclear transport factor 2 family protein [Pseudomonas syringae]|uniref:nuclear transport factor 2 family protein n=1 Tax=Pseudomonas syringae TaxID=317 RepID=UPI001F1048B1|nr:nuclear transport factor 2 family protein [Pseudomonas syringae]MCH5487736.1 nuclear transport factor 2 family protein [Pseudomonas syringae pv. syringae]MDO1458879.1 nuclear transport factor 2 family protein [Pseudomonas syringae pv. syringae]